MGEIIFLIVLLLLGGVLFQQTFTFGVSILDQSGGPALDVYKRQSLWSPFEYFTETS